MNKHNGKTAYTELFAKPPSKREQEIEARALELVGDGVSIAEARRAARYEKDCEDAPGHLYADDDPDWH